MDVNAFNFAYDQVVKFVQQHGIKTKEEFDYELTFKIHKYISSVGMTDDVINTIIKISVKRAQSCWLKYEGELTVCTEKSKLVSSSQRRTEQDKGNHKTSDWDCVREQNVDYKFF